MSANCDRCNDTGSLSKDLEGSLDCGYCTTAETRAALEAWALREKLDCSVTALWVIYNKGRQDATKDRNA